MTFAELVQRIQLHQIRLGQQVMELHPFGNTTMRVSAVGFGSYKMSAKPGGSTLEEVTRLLGTILDSGVNVIDTAECYGQGEELLGQALAQLGTRRAEVYLFTKCGHAAGLNLPDWSPQLLERSIERSLLRLRTDYLDLLQLHSCSLEQLRRGEVIEVLQRARAAGKTRAIGYSGDGPAARYAVECAAFDALQTSVNIADQEAITLTLPLAQAKHMGIIAKRSLANTAWLSRQDPSDSAVAAYHKRLITLNYPFLHAAPDEAISTALRFTLSVPTVDIMLIGGTNADHWRRNLALLEEGPLPQPEFEAIRAHWNAMTWWRKVLPMGRMRWHGRV
jgi:aryl-alcohol dehydrogenase-like predicted oxidoreductase